MIRDQSGRCCHCGESVSRLYFKYCPYCGEKLSIPVRCDIDPLSYVKTLGRIAYVLPDIQTTQWEALDLDFISEAEVLYQRNDGITLRAAFLRVAASCIGSGDGVDRFIRSVGYRVVGELSDEILPLMTVEERNVRWDIEHPVDESFYDDGAYYHQGYWDDEIECCDADEDHADYSGRDLSLDCRWILEGDVLLRGYILHDKSRRKFHLRVPGMVWDSFVKEAGGEDVPADSKIVLSSIDFCEDQDDRRDGEWIDDLIRIEAFKGFERGGASKRIRLLTREEMFSIREKELQEERRNRKPIKV